MWYDVSYEWQLFTIGDLLSATGMDNNLPAWFLHIGALFYFADILFICLIIVINYILSFTPVEAHFNSASAEDYFSCNHANLRPSNLFFVEHLSVLLSQSSYIPQSSTHLYRCLLPTTRVSSDRVLYRSTFGPITDKFYRSRGNGPIRYSITALDFS